MKLELKRDVFADTFTLGTLLANGKHLGFTCEDTDRKLEDGNEKIYGKTAIPRGKYKVIISYSQRFKKPMPEVLDVPGFSGVRIHGGNVAEDSLGCVLLGAMRTQNGTANCAVINQKLIALIEQAEENGEKVYLEIS